jgi:hypothetical protein
MRNGYPGSKREGLENGVLLGLERYYNALLCIYLAENEAKNSTRISIPGTGALRDTQTIALLRV